MPQQAQLAATATAAGLRVQAQLDAATACDYCVAKNVLSATYAARCRLVRLVRHLLTPCPQAARDRNIPIVTQAWVHACVANGLPLAADQVAQYLLPPFTGLRICVTGLEVGACRRAADPPLL